MNRIKLLLLATGLAWSLFACSPSPELQATMTATALNTMATMWMPSTTSTPTATLTPLRTPTPTATPTPALTPTHTLTPSQTPDPDRYYPPGTSISLVSPEGWVPIIIEQIPGLVGPQVGNFFPRIFFHEEPDDSMLGRYTAQMQDSISPEIAGYKPIKEDFLTTPDDLPYARWEFQGTADDGTVNRFVIYIFDTGELKEILQYLRPMNSGQKFDEQVEEAINTVRFEE